MRFARFFVACGLALSACARPPAEPLVLATTTSVGNSGLLDALLPRFEKSHGLPFRVHLAGSGLALLMLDRGEADLVISHAPAAEREALRAHTSWRYRRVMFNDFVIVGPPADPAGVRQAADAGDAMRRIARSRARFLSRGDQSGTHEREDALWNVAGQRPADGLLVVAGAAMGMDSGGPRASDAQRFSDWRRPAAAANWSRAIASMAGKCSSRGRRDDPAASRTPCPAEFLPVFPSGCMHGGGDLWGAKP